jgi:aminocarboxymuconate-semialdehyde decarboxylase
MIILKKKRRKKKIGIGKMSSHSQEHHCGNSLCVDIHTHILPKNIPDLTKKYGYGGWVSLEHDQPNEKYTSYAGVEHVGTAKMMENGKQFRQVHSTLWCVDHRVKDCDHTKVSIQVLSTVPVMFSYWAKPEDTLDLARYLNDHIAQTVAENPKRFIGLGTLPMQAPDLAVKELRRCISDLGLAGIQIGTIINEWTLDAPELDPIFAACEELNAAIFIHPWGMQTDGRMGKYWFPWLVGMPCETTMAVCCLILGGVLEKYPKLKICLAHGGGSFPATVARIQHGFEVRPDLCAIRNKKGPMAYMDRIWVDSLVHDPDVLELLIKKFGDNRIVMGSDYPFILGEHKPGELIHRCDYLTEEQKKKILYKNALEFLGVSEEQFH